jgi:hypothetical protein
MANIWSGNNKEIANIINDERSVPFQLFFILCNQKINTRALASKTVENCAGISEQSMGARNRAGLGLPYRARICKRSLAGQYEKDGFVPARQAGNRFLVSLKDLQIRAQARQAA